MAELSCGKINNNIDVLIVGAGPIGLAAALWFAKQSVALPGQSIKQNYNIVLIEQYSDYVTGHLKASGESKSRRSFNERHQQVGLDSESIFFLKELDVVVWGQVKRKGFIDGNWINIPIYTLQNILIREVKNYNNVKILFDTKIESVNCVDPRSNCRILMVRNNIVYGLSPKLVIIADGKHSDQGTAQQFFGFSSACKVHLSTYGIVGMIVRNINDEKGSVFLKNHSSDSYVSDSHQELGNMYIRLLGNMKERYIALGLGDTNVAMDFLALNETQIRSLLVEAYNLKRDKRMGEPQIKESDFLECSKTPIPIVLDYRKETIKLLEGSSTIVSIEGDAARKTTFFSGSGLNTGYRALMRLFNFCNQNQALIFNHSIDSNDLLTIDQKLLEKDQDCLHISLELLIKGINYIGTKDQPLDANNYLENDPVIESITPNEAEVPWFIYINGNNLLGAGGKPPTCLFKWNDQIHPTDDVIVYDNTMVGVKIPRNAENKVSISLKRFDGKTATSPIQFTAIIIAGAPEITDIHEEDKWLCIDGKNFKPGSYVMMCLQPNGKQCPPGKERIKAYCNSANSLVFAPPHKLSGKITFTVHTDNGSSNELVKNFDTS